MRSSFSEPISPTMMAELSHNFFHRATGMYCAGKAPSLSSWHVDVC
jgi:hypothetical protein